MVSSALDVIIMAGIGGTTARSLRIIQESKPLLIPKLVMPIRTPTREGGIEVKHNLQVTDLKDQ